MITHSASGIVLSLLVGTRFQILFHSPRRGSFHLSLTVLLRYRSSSVFRLGGWTPQFPTRLACRVVLRILNLCFGCMYGALTLFSRPSQTVPLHLCRLQSVLQPQWTRPLVWPHPLSLATTRGIISFPQPTWMFRFGWFPRPKAYRDMTRGGFPHSDISGY